MDLIVWILLYSLIAMCGKGWLKETAAEPVPSTRAERGVRSNARTRQVHLRPGRAVESRQSLVDQATERTCPDNMAVVGQLLKALEDDVQYHSAGKEPPLTFLYHKTLKKVEGRPHSERAESDRIRVSPLNSEKFERLDFPLSELNRFHKTDSLPSKNEDEQTYMDKLVCFLNAMLKEQEAKCVRYRTNDNTRGTGVKLFKRWDGSILPPLKSKSDFVKMLVAAYPLQVSMFNGGLLKHYLDKSNSNGKYKPEPLESKGSADSSSSSSTNDSVDLLINKIMNRGSEALAELSCSKNLSCLNTNYSNTNANYGVDTPRKLVTNQNAVDRIHQSAEETVFKSVLNELISDVPKNLMASTYRPVDVALEDGDKEKGFEARVKAAKHAQETATSAAVKELPCMKIRVQNGPVTLTFQSHVRRQSTKKPVMEPYYMTGYKLNGDSSSPVVNSSTLLASETLLKNLVTGLTDEANSMGNVMGKFNDTSNYYSTNDIEPQSENSFLDDSLNRDKAKLFNALRSNRPAHTSSWNFISTGENNREVNKTGAVRTDVAQPSQDQTTKNTSQSNRDSAVTNSSKQDYNYNVNIYPLKMILSSYRDNAATSCLVARNRTFIPSLYYNVEPYLKPTKNLYVSRTGLDDFYKMTRFGDHSRPSWNMDSHYFLDSTRNRYVPKLYYNELVVSKGLVGQHPPKQETLGSSTILSDSTLKKMETLNILKYYLDSLSSHKNFTLSCTEGPFLYNPIMKGDKKYFIST